MGEKEIKQYYEILELKPNASFSEIKSAFYHLKKLYSSQSPVLSVMSDDISENRHEQIVAQIEDAYKNLKEFHSAEKTEKQKVTHDRVMKKNIPEFEVFSGNALKLTREVLGVRLEEISLATGIPINHLNNIERERFDMLPPSGYIRIYITKYAQYLSLDPKIVTRDYMKAVNNKKSRRDQNRF